MKKTIKIKFQNGIDFNIASKEIFFELHQEFEFIEELQNPDFILFGPYGNNIPPKGNYVRIGYYCENITPDLSLCEWAFGIPLESEINHPNYKRIQWHGIKPESFIKKFTDNDIDRIINEKTNFCNFLYSNEVSYREEFFRQLSKYKKIDSPGKSMNNMASIDSIYDGDVWNRKRAFLSSYKFTIAFENYVYPGYQTEKIYDAMNVGSIPIYFGDANIGEVFNTKSFINAADYLDLKDTKMISWLEKKSQQNFKDIRPQHYNGIFDRIIRKLKKIGRIYKMNLQTNRLNFSPLIDRIIEIDNNKELYIEYLKQPWLINNQIPAETTHKKHWTKIFNDRPHK